MLPRSRLSPPRAARTSTMMTTDVGLLMEPRKRHLWRTLQAVAPSSRAILAGGAIVAWAACTPALATSTVKTFGDWTLYSERGQQQICFLASPPSETAPPGVKRETALLYVSAWPKEGVRSEVSVKLGFPLRKNTEPSISVTGANPGQPAAFRAFVRDDRAFVADPTQELKLLEAMKKGTRLTVQATSERGMVVTDTYSLAGISAGLQALAAGCP